MSLSMIKHIPAHFKTWYVRLHWTTTQTPKFTKTMCRCNIVRKAEKSYTGLSETKTLGEREEDFLYCSGV